MPGNSPIRARPAPTRGRAARALALAAGGLIAASGAAPAGCASEPRLQGDGPVMATHSLGTLSAELGDDIRVQAVIAAAGDALRSRGYMIESSSATADAGRISARPPQARRFERVIVRAELTTTGTRATVAVRPTGDEARARAILDGILARLGL
jgi:hypothetical protein